MADDPNRDILPVKDDSCYGSVRCSSEIDPRERHVVCKLDRYQLEDRYLRLLEEVQGLKKLSNSQEDKIKRLTTKLMRSAATSRTCPAVLAINDEREKITRLELENSRLKDKAYSLKNQLVSHRGPRSPSRCRRVASGISSGPTTYRSESARTKYQSQPREVVDDNDVQNYLVKIEELETQRNEMATRIADLESQIAVHVAGIQREKVQDNVEYIRMWRQMKQSNDKLVSVQATNDMLHSQIGDLKKLLEETTKNNREVTAALVTEKQRLSEMDDQITSAKDSQLSSREKDEQIRDLTNEMKILQQHNNELIALSSKFGQVEVENIELKRKVAEYVQDNQSLRSAYNSEQADHAALRSANDKLIKKIEELQRNMDNLTMQLMTFQNQGEKRLVSKGTQSEEVKHVDKKIGPSYVSNSRSMSSEEERDSFSEKATNCERKLRFPEKESDRGKAKEISTNGKPESKDRSGVRSVPTSIKNPRTISSKTKHNHHAASPSMSREKILMLLDQAQISTPLEAQNAARMRQIDAVAAATGQNEASIFPESYRIPITTLQRRSNHGFGSIDIPSTPGDDDDQSHENTEFYDPKQILLTLFEILKSYSENVQENIECNSCICGDMESSSTETIEGGNLNDSKYQSEAESSSSAKNFERGNKINETCAIFDERLENGISKTKTLKGESRRGPSNLLNKFTETECCTCDSNHMCLATSDCGYGCCAPGTDIGLTFFDKNHFSSRDNPAVVKSRVGEIGSTIQKVFDSIHAGCDFDFGCTAECCDEEKALNTNNQSKIDNGSKVVSRELERCKDLLRDHYNSKSDYKKDVKHISNCEADCHTANECGDTPEFCEMSPFPLLITKGQGLIEIHILELQLSAKATQTLFNNESEDISVFISWEVWGQEEAFTPIMKYPSLSFNSSSVYRVCELQNFFENVLREHIVFHVHVINPNEETFTVARAKLSVKDILDYPQNKLHYITPVLSVMPCSCGGNFGQLSLWIRLSCDIDLVENFKDRCGLNIPVSKHQRIQIPAPFHGNEESQSSSSNTKKEFSSMNSTSLDNLDAFVELTTLSVPDVMQEIPEQHRNASGSLPEVKSNRLDTIRESAEPGYPADPNKKDTEKGKYRYENPEEVWSDTNIQRNASLTRSIATNDNPSEDSNAEIDGTIEDTTPQDSELVTLQQKRDSGEQIESGSITEFNNVLKNQTDGSSLHEADSTINDLGTVIADDKWEKYKRNSSDRTSISVFRSNLMVQSSIAFRIRFLTQMLYGIVVSFILIWREKVQDLCARRKLFSPPAKDTITLSIVSMHLFDRTSLMDNPDIDLLYVEYSFLGMRGADMETISLPKPKTKGEPMVFNFTRKFQIDEASHYSQRNMLNAMLCGTASPLIRFVIVSEPLPEEVDTKECLEVGHANLNIREYALGDGLRVIPLIIMNPSQSEQFGMLKITIDGIEIIRNCMMVQKRL